MTETTDVAWTIVVRIEDTDRWIDWSTGHRTVPDVLAAAELIVPVSTIAEIRFDRITTARKRFSLADLGATDAAAPSVPADADLRDRIVNALLTTRRTDYEGTADHRQHRYDARCALCAYDVDALADAVLADLPAPADRAAVLREAAREVDNLTQETAGADMTAAEGLWYAGLDAGVRKLRRMADEAQPAGGCPGCGCAEHRGFCDCGCLDDRRAAETQQNERVKHSGPETEFCVLCLSGDHERVSDQAQQAEPTRRVLTPNEHDRVWYAIEGAAGEPGADPGTVLNAVLAALGIDAPTAEEEQADSPRR